MIATEIVLCAVRFLLPRSFSSCFLAVLQYSFVSLRIFLAVTSILGVRRHIYTLSPDLVWGIMLAVLLYIQFGFGTESEDIQWPSQDCWTFHLCKELAVLGKLKSKPRNYCGVLVMERIRLLIRTNKTDLLRLWHGHEQWQEIDSRRSNWSFQCLYCGTDLRKIREKRLPTHIT